MDDDFRHLELIPEEMEKLPNPKCFSTGKKPLTVSSATLHPKYSKQLVISSTKRKDLLDLCKTRVIDSVYHSWYESLPTCTGKVDHIPPPDINERSADNDDNN